MKKYFLLILSFSGCLFGNAQYSLTTSSYTQDFNGLGTATSTNVTGGSLNNVNASLNGWYFAETAASANTTITAGTGSSGTGDTYNFGLAANADRTLGGLRSGSLIPNFGFYFTNNTGGTITALQITYTGETWRRGFNNISDRLNFQYSTSATSILTGTWTNADPLDYANPVGGIPPGSGSVLHSATIDNFILNISIANGASLFIRWTDQDATDADDGMGIDDFTMTVADPTPVVFYSKSSGNLTSLSTWGDDPSGSGTAPSNFTNPFQQFNIVNRSSTTLNANWTVSGVNSKVILGDGASSATFVLPSSAALTGTIDVSDQAILRLENSTLPVLGIVEDGSTINYAQTGAYTLPVGTFHNLTITNGAKTLGNGNTVVNGNMVLDGVTSLNGWLGGSGSTIILSGNLTLQNGAAFATSGALPSLEIGETGAHTLSGGEIRLNNLVTPDDETAAVSVLLSNANLRISFLRLYEVAHTLSLNGNTLFMQNIADFGDPAEVLGSISGTSTSVINIFKSISNGGTPNALRMTNDARVLGTLEYRDLSSDPPLALASPLSISNTVVLHILDNITTTSANLLTLLQGAEFTGPGLGSAIINGPLARVTNAAGAYQFPIGGNTGTSVFLQIPTAGNTSTFRMQYFQTGIQTGAPICPAPNALSGFKIDEYFDVSRTSGTSPASLSVQFDGQNLNGPDWNNNIAPADGDGIIIARYNEIIIGGITSADNCWEGVSSSAPLLPFPQATISTDVLTSFSPFTFGYIDFGSLPVKFANVKAYRNGSGIKTEWSNLTETNVANYTIERSANGRDFTALSSVNATRNDGGRADYTYFDAQPLNGVNFYRIRSLETDGHKLYSIVVRVDTKESNSDIVIYPNPVANNTLALQTPAAPKGIYQLFIYNASGQKVYGGQLTLSGSAATQSVQLPQGLRPGVYYLQLNGDNGRFAKSFLVQ